MKDFDIRNETRTPNYEFKESPARKGLHLLSSAYLLSSITSCIFIPPLAGDIAYIPTDFTTKSEFNLYVNNLFRTYDIELVNDYTLVHIDGGSPDLQIDFRADGYHSAKRIAVEWVSLPHYDLTHDTERITPSEMELITNDFMDGTYLLLIESVNKPGISSEFRAFISRHPDLTNSSDTNQ